MKSKFLLAATLLALGAAGSAFADAIPYAPVGTPNAATYTFKSDGGDVVAYFLGSGASYNETLGLLVNGTDSGITGLQNHMTAIGTALDFGTIAAGTTLTFYIDVQSIGRTFYSDESLNADGVNHVYSTSYTGPDAPAGTYVAFEDQYGGGDFNYHDETFAFTSVTTTAAVPEPENVALLLAGMGLLGMMARRRRG